MHSPLIPPNALPCKEYEQTWYVTEFTERVKAELPWYSGGAPSVRLTTGEAGMACVVCGLQWGRGRIRIHIESSPMPTFDVALADAIKVAKSVNDEGVSDWMALVEKRTNGASRSTPKFENTVAVGLPMFVASVVIRGGERLKSNPHPTRLLAFEELMCSFNADLALVAKEKRAEELRRAPKIKPPVKPTPPLKKTMPKNPQKVFSADEGARSIGDALRYLDAAKMTWQVAHAHLLSLPNTSKKDAERLHALSEFLILCDPLRKYEIEPRRRELAIADLVHELRRFIESTTTEDGIAQRDIAALRALSGKPFVGAGIELHALEPFKAWCSRLGLNHTEILKSLIKRQLVRKDASGTLAMSTVGASQLEQFIVAERGQAGLGAKLSAKALIQLEELRASLS